MPKTNKIIQSFNAGELSLLMDQRSDQQKYAAGCRIMENMIPLIYGGAQERPGLEFIATQRSSSAKGRLVAFEHSVDDAYILLFENQFIRFFKNGAQVFTGGGTEDLSALDNIVAHWKLNEIEGTTVFDSVDSIPHTGTASTDTSDLTAIGKVKSCFDFDGQHDVTVNNDGELSFTNNSIDEDFSIAAWVFVTDGGLQSILSKWRDDNATKEWRFSMDPQQKLQLHLADTSANIAADRIAQWKLNEDAANTTVLDDTAANHDGTTQVGNTEDVTATGKIGKCFDFGGAEYIEITSDHNDLSLSSASSVAAWVFVDPEDAFGTVISKASSATVGEWRLQTTDTGKISMKLIDNSTGGSVWTETDGSIGSGWHFVVVNYDGTETAAGIDIYVDNVLVDVTTGAAGSFTAMENTAVKVTLGAYTGGTGIYPEKLDNITMFSRELTTSEIGSLWNSGNGTEEMPSYEISAVSNAAMEKGWRFVVATYEATNGSYTAATAANFITLYVDGAVVTSTKTNNANYTAMQGGAEEVRIGSQRNSGDTSGESFWEDKIDNVALFSDKLSAAEIADLIDLEVIFEVNTPYLTADLPDLKFEQSADVTFITHPNYETRRFSRLADDNWILEASDIQTGPFRDQNTDTAKTITASATTGSVTLTAVGHAPFVSGTTAGHLPSGSADRSKSQTGALFKLVQATDTPSISEEIEANTLNDTSGTLAVPKGVTWDFTTNGTWGAAGDSATIVLERSYDNETTYETVVTVTSAANKNVTTSGTEGIADALYRARTSSACAADTDASIQFSIRDTSHIGIVEITAVASPTSATATVLTTLASTDPTHRFSEGSFSNLRGWPIDVTISSEERLTFAGNISEPLTTWGSVIGDFTDFREGTDADDALTLTLVGSGQQNRIRWMLSKNTLVLGTVGGEHILGASKDDEALTPTNIRTRLQTTYGSENIAAKIVNQAVLFVQRGGRKIREFLYSFEQDSHKADDLTVFAEHITESGIVDMAFQRTPDPILWCVRADGEMATMTYERDQNVFSWSRQVSEGGTSDAEFESVAVIYGGAGNEDEVWVTIKRVINTATTPTTVRYVERFFQRAMPSSISDMKYLDSYITDIGDTDIRGLGHLEGETVQVLGDGLVQATRVVSSAAITAESAANKYQVGLGYTATVKPMKLDLNGMGLAITKKINRGVFSVFETIGGEVGTSTSKLHDIPTGTAALFTGSKEIPLSGGYSREGDILARQTQPLPMTVLSFSLDVGANAD